MAKPDPLKAIRKYCLWCCCGRTREVELCPFRDCPLWPFRLGRKIKEERWKLSAQTAKEPNQPKGKKKEKVT